MRALCSLSRNSLGLEFPSCGRGVTVPTSAAAKPSVCRWPSVSAFLSNPAARHIGWRSLPMPGRSLVCSLPETSSGVSGLFGLGTTPFCSAQMATLCAASGGSRQSVAKPSLWIQVWMFIELLIPFLQYHQTASVWVGYTINTFSTLGFALFWSL